MDTVQFKGHQVKIKKLVSGAQSMLNALTTKMYDLSGGSPIACITPAKHVDDLSSTQRGTSWLDSAHTQPREHALMHSMVHEGRWNLSWVAKDGTLRWNKTACNDFMRKAADIVDLIITLVHIGSGPPLRGEEIVREQIRNGVQLRTIYLSFGQIIGVRRHSKVTNARGMDSFNVCYFPQCLTEAICYYLLVIRPLESLVASQIYKGKAAVQEYDLFLYVKYGKRMTSTQFSATLETLTGKYVGIGLGLQPLRHILIAFQRAFVEELRIDRGDNIGDLISSHTSQTADAHYAVEHGQPEGYTTSRLLDIQEWCDSYHDAIGLGDRTVPLVPLRFSRQRARRLGTVLSTAGSGDPSVTTEVLFSLIKELTATAHKSAMEDLKLFISGELRTTSAEALQYLLSAYSIPGPEQPRGSDSNTPEPSGTRTKKGLPLRSTPQPPFPTATVEANTTRAPKRVLSSGEQPPSKKQSSSLFTNPLMRSSLRHNPTYPEEDVDANLQITPALGQTTSLRDPDQWTTAQDPTTEPSTPSTPAIALPATSETEEESTAIAKLSSMSLRAHQPVVQINNPAGDRVSSGTEDHTHSRAQDHARSQAQDHVSSRPDGHTSSPHTHSRSKDPLTALRELRRDPQAEFKSIEQRKLIDSILTRNHTLAVLPTGGGKSIAYELPPLCEGQLTIAAFPFRVLSSQAAQQCRERGMNFEHWTSMDQRSVEGKRLVIMAIETLCTPNMIA